MTARPPGAESLARELGVSPTFAALLWVRGATEADAARRFLRPRLSDLRPPERMAGLPAAVDCLARALGDGRRIGVFGDYDVDGITSAALIGGFLRALGARPVTRVGRREAGYGLAEADAEALAEAGCEVVVACDCGTSDHRAVDLLRGRGIEVVVVDHHQVPAEPVAATALVNPQQPACGFPFKGLASVGLSFYLCAALRTALRTRGAASAPLPDPREWLDLVALGTVADMAPLVEENRILAWHGLRALARAPRAGLRALAAIAGLEVGSAAEAVRAADIAFRLAPRLNAPGRLGDAAPALDLMLEDDPDRARVLAATCDRANRNRQQLQEAVYGEAVKQLDGAGAGAPMLVVAGQGWHPGVVGIVAAKLVERYGVPAAVIALDGAVGRGSARTIPGFDLYSALSRCGSHLLRYGGHAAAAGMTVETARVDALRAALEETARTALPEGPQPRSLHVDTEVPLDAVDERLCRELMLLEPCGPGNPEPLMCTSGLTVLDDRLVGEREDHLLLTLGDGAARLSAIGFRLAGLAPGVGAAVDVSFVAELDEFRGVTQPRMRLRDLRSAATMTVPPSSRSYERT